MDKAIALEAKPDSVIVTVVARSAGDEKIVLFETISMPEDESRPVGLSRIRARIHTLVEQQKPAGVFVKPLEPFALSRASRARPTMAWFETAEVRGVCAEAAAAAGAPTSFRGKSDVNKTIGDRDRGDYLEDDAFWDERAPQMPKKYRETTLIALSALRENA